MHLLMMALAIFALAPNQQVGEMSRRCPAPFETLLSDKVFRAYPAKLPPSGMKIVPPSVNHGEAHTYRTALRSAAKRGPNFAGRYTIAHIGCGASTVCVAISDAQTGAVYFPTELQSATALMVDPVGTNFEILNYRPYSRLLIVVGSPNEDSKKAGISYYLWDGRRFRLKRFEPAARLCSLPSDTSF